MKRIFSTLVTITNSPESMCGVYSGRCLPRRMLAMVTASRPTIWSVASITYHRRSIVCGLAMKVVMSGPVRLIPYETLKIGDPCPRVKGRFS